MEKLLEEHETISEEALVLEYSPPEIEDLDLDECVTPEMTFSAPSGMGMCKHTYIQTDAAWVNATIAP